MHANCHHVNTSAANALCASFRQPVVAAFGGSYIREHMHRVQANAALKTAMDRRAASN